MMLAYRLCVLFYVFAAFIFAVFIFAASDCGTATAQEVRPPAENATRMDLSPTIASVGQPFGTLFIEVPLSNSTEVPLRSPQVVLEDEGGRVFYPVVSVRSIDVAAVQTRREVRRPGGLIDRLRNAVRGEAETRTVPVAITITALIRGETPFEVRVRGDVNQSVRVVPRRLSEAKQRELLSTWWAGYTASAREAIQGNDFPRLIHKYLVAMLADRLGLPKVDLDPPEGDEEELSQPLKSLALLAAIEPLRDQIFEDLLSVAGDAAVAELPVPSEPSWADRSLPLFDGGFPIEELAFRIPPECFYLRFGSFSNYVWFQELSERYGGDLAQAVLLRGFNAGASTRMERMLATQMTAVAKLFGDNLIGDMAVIGSDLYMKEGPSLGVLFYAKSPGLLAKAIDADRTAAAGRNPDATLETVTIAGKQVSLLSTPDNRIRSFYVSDGPCVFITTSQFLVQRFLEVGFDGKSLAKTTDFQLARSWMPDANGYSVFAYFSPAFFHRLVSPQYQIELRRRLEAIAHLELAEVATQVAKAEGLAAQSVQEMQLAGLLPVWFDKRADGALTLRSGEQWIDSTRGARGSFLPISDVQLFGVTQREADLYADIADFYQDEWQSMDPLLIGLRRFDAEDDALEKVAIEAYIAPFDAGKYGWIARQLGEPTPVEIQLPTDDVASVQLHVRGSPILGSPIGEEYHLFAGVKDMIPPSAEDTKGLLKTLQALRVTPAYIGAWPKPGLVEQLPLGLGRALAQPDYAGFSRMLGGLWRWQDESFSVLSFDRSILEQTRRQLGVAEASDVAQARLNVVDLCDSQISTWINNKWFERGWQSSHGNAILLDTVGQQLKVPPADCIAVAERLLDGKIQCPLGGKYQYGMPESARGEPLAWTSSAWRNAIEDGDGEVRAPADYQAPWIDWFRGGRVHVTQRPGSLAIVGELKLEMQPLAAIGQSAAPVTLPSMNFDLFSLPMKIFGGSSSAKPSVERKSF